MFYKINKYKNQFNQSNKFIQKYKNQSNKFKINTNIINNS